MLLIGLLEVILCVAVMWELFSDGDLPYYQHQDNQTVGEMILNGERLKKPKDCPDDVFKVMECCWEEEPEQRPSFKVSFVIVHSKSLEFLSMRVHISFRHYSPWLRH